MLIPTSTASNVDFINFLSQRSFSLIARFVVVDVSAMEFEVQVMGWQKAKGMISSLMTGDIIGHHIGGTQVLEHSAEYCGSGVLIRGARGKREIASACSLGNSLQEPAARACDPGCISGATHVDRVNQGARALRRPQRLARRMQTDGVVAVREQDYDAPNVAGVNCAAMLREEINSEN